MPTAHPSTRRTALLRLLPVLALPMIAGLSACGTMPSRPDNTPQVAAAVDLPRYMGRWYIIANTPYFAERGFVGSYSEWHLRPRDPAATSPGGESPVIDDHYYGRKGGFNAELSHHQFEDIVVPGSGGGEWQVKLFGPLTARQVTLWVDPEYRHTLVGVRGTSWGWIFSRTPQMDDATYQGLLKRFASLGYDPTRFRRVPQRPEDIGQPGFAGPED